MTFVACVSRCASPPSLARLLSEPRVCLPLSLLLSLSLETSEWKGLSPVVHVERAVEVTNLVSIKMTTRLL